MQSNNDHIVSFKKNYLKNYINDQNDIACMSSNGANSININNLLLKCDQEKESQLIKMSYLKEDYLKYSSNVALSTDKWNDSENMITKAITDLLSNTKEGSDLNYMKKDIEADVDFMGNKLSQYSNIEFKNHCNLDRKIFQEKLRELKNKFDEKTDVNNQLNITSKSNIQQRGIIIDFIINNAKSNCKKIVEQKIEICDQNLESLFLIQELSKTKHENQTLKEKLGKYEKMENEAKNLENLLEDIDLLAAKNMANLGIQPRILKQKNQKTPKNGKNMSANKNSQKKLTNLNQHNPQSNCWNGNVNNFYHNNELIDEKGLNENKENCNFSPDGKVNNFGVLNNRQNGGIGLPLWHNKMYRDTSQLNNTSNTTNQTNSELRTPRREDMTIMTKLGGSVIKDRSMRTSMHSNMSKRYEQEKDEDSEEEMQASFRVCDNTNNGNISSFGDKSRIDSQQTDKKFPQKNYQTNDKPAWKLQGLSPIPYNHNTSNSSNNSYFWSPENCKRNIIQNNQINKSNKKSDQQSPPSMGNKITTNQETDKKEFSIEKKDIFNNTSDNLNTISEKKDYFLNSDLKFIASPNEKIERKLKNLTTEKKIGGRPNSQYDKTLSVGRSSNKKRQTITMASITEDKNDSVHLEYNDKINFKPINDSDEIIREIPNSRSSLQEIRDNDVCLEQQNPRESSLDTSPEKIVTSKWIIGEAYAKNKF